ncbi:D-alanyl-D-alanine carboxypeptidase Short=DD-carboxypeptidase [Fibrisoma limi BUZ 3]|uniref:D-alanyl-D-alanine carboxypeptidase Short=DD-carboxypeptidase n=1 Tax=Fibrisoma limi BUZ 3 TaxID=1185876 RepID=I2GDA1_9BACT|nr:serine hydrolase domain-containing protein [Fibrisoma limi]CCH51875.1 D-alanyl-D-alanine carboxypeptidase Short=DD-carboxypeptidase [Fibrisoma limi BUZ 3]
MTTIVLHFLRASHAPSHGSISRRTSRLWLLLNLAGLLFACADHREPDPDDQNQLRVQAAVDSVRRALEDSLGHTVPSMSVLIQTPSQTYFASSVPAGQSPITPQTYFRFASNTKNFTATAILNMYEDGWLDYKAKITDLMPGSTQPYVPATAEWNFPNKDQITIEQLLQHSAGVYDVDNDSVPGFNGMSYTEAVQTADPTHQFTTEEMVHQLILNQLSYFAPGTGYHYSNTGYSILSYIIARVYSARSGLTKTYGDYLYDYVVGPGAPIPVTIRFPVRADDTVLPSPRVEGLELLPGNIQKRYGDYNMSAQVGEGNGYGNMASLNSYIRSLMKGQNVLTPQTVKLMQTSVSSANPTYALGCTFTPNLGYGHNGARIGNLAVMAYDPLTDVSLVAYLPLWDLTDGFTSFIKCFNGMYDAAYAARKSLGYPGKP